MLFIKWEKSISCIGVLFSLFVATEALAVAADTRLDYKEISEFKIIHAMRVDLVVNEKSIGTVSYLRIPGTNVFVFYELFINGEERGKGYAKHLGEAALKRVLTTNKTSYILIQPETFDPSNFPHLTEDQRKEQRDRLVGTYAKRGFAVYNKAWLAPVLGVLYRLMGIKEDPRFFMIGKGEVLKSKVDTFSTTCYSGENS
jgi:GNAT superfamily N-acetyltransferase